MTTSPAPIRFVFFGLIRVQRGDRRSRSVLRRCRVPAEHLVTPIDAGVDYSDVHAVAFKSAGAQSVELSQLRRIAVIERGTRVINRVIEIIERAAD